MFTIENCKSVNDISLILLKILIDPMLVLTLIESIVLNKPTVLDIDIGVHILLMYKLIKHKLLFTVIY